MANSYNSNPVTLDTDMASGWRSNQTLATKQPGIRVTKLLLVAASGTQTAGTVVIQDPNDGTTLWNVAVASGTVTAGTILTREDFEDNFPAWRDFKVTGLTATGTRIYIWYR